MREEHRGLESKRDETSEGGISPSFDLLRSVFRAFEGALPTSLSGSLIDLSLFLLGSEAKLCLFSRVGLPGEEVGGGVGGGVGEGEGDGLRRTPPSAGPELGNSSLII